MNGFKFLKKMEMDKWSFDVSHFERWKANYLAASSNSSREICMRNMVRLQSKWPHHKLGDLPE